jgi:hypothetical protein
MSAIPGPPQPVAQRPVNVVSARDMMRSMTMKHVPGRSHADTKRGACRLVAAALAAWACAALAAAPALAQAPGPAPDQDGEAPQQAPPQEPQVPQEPLPQEPQVPQPQEQQPQEQQQAGEHPLEQQAPDTIMVERDPPKPEPEPEPDPDLGRLVDQQHQTCDPYVVQRKAQHIGLGVEIGTGYQQNTGPVEPLSLAVGVTAERMLSQRLALGFRMSYLTAGDESQDQDLDGRDDRDTGNAHLVSFTAGPRLRRWSSLDRDDPSLWELGLAAGYVQALSDVGASGPVAEIELRHTWSSVVSLGLRGTQGFVDAEPYRAVLASVWLGVVSTPERSWGAGCDFVERRRDDDGPGLGLGVHLPLVGAGISALGGDLGVMPPGLGLSLAIQMRYPVDLILRGDFLWFLRQERDRLAMHTGLAGLRVAPARKFELSFTALAGYAIAYRPTPSNIDSGPVLDLGVSWDFARERKGGLYLGAHGRFGLSSDNRDLGALFLSLGLEVRNDAYAW